MKRILWISRHEPLEDQLDELKKRFGEVEIEQVSQYFNSGKSVYNLMQEMDCDAIVTILPIDYMAELNDLGVNPLIAIMRRYYNSKDKAKFSHEKFVRVNELELQDLVNH